MRLKRNGTAGETMMGEDGEGQSSSGTTAVGGTTGEVLTWRDMGSEMGAMSIRLGVLT